MKKPLKLANPAGRLRRFVMLLMRLRGNFRIRHNECHACKSDTPEVDSCPICEAYDSRNQFDVYPPEGWRKIDWRNRYDSYLEYLYIENPPELEWDGAQWIVKHNVEPCRRREWERCWLEFVELMPVEQRRFVMLFFLCRWNTQNGKSADRNQSP